MTAIGLHAGTGQRIQDELTHIKQSIHTILTTPIGSRIMRRNFGSLIPDLIDKPLNTTTHMQLVAASVMAIQNWEPRVRIQRVTLARGTEASSVYAHLELSLKTDGQAAFAIPLGDV